MNAHISTSSRLFQRLSSSGGIFLPDASVIAQFSEEARRLASERFEAAHGRGGRRFDGCDSRPAIASRQLLAQFDSYFRSGEGKFDDADMPVAMQGLTHFFQEVRERSYADLPAYNGDILPISEDIDPGAETYVWYERDLFGQAMTVSTYDEASVPMVGGPTAIPNTGRIKPFLNGWKTNFRTKAREALMKRNGKPDFREDQGKEEAAERGHTEAINALWLWGDKPWGIPGLAKETRIRVIPAPDGVLSSPLWVNKTVDEQIRDVLLAINAIHTYSNKTLRCTRLLMPQEHFDLISGSRISGTDGTVLSYINKVQQEKRQPVEIRGMLELNVANSESYDGGPPELAFNRMVAIAVDKKLACFELPVRPEIPMAPKNTGLGEVFFKHSRAGGLNLKDAQSIVFVDGI